MWQNVNNEVNNKDEGLKNIGHSKSIRNPIFGVNGDTASVWLVMTVYY